MTCVRAGGGDGDASATTPGDGEASGDPDLAGASVGGGPLSLLASAVARASPPTGAPSRGRSIRCGPHPTDITMARATSTIARMLKIVLRSAQGEAVPSPDRTVTGPVSRDRGAGAKRTQAY